MVSQTFSARRSRATNKPVCSLSDPTFYSCPRCGAFLWTALQSPNETPRCCGAPMETCIPLAPEQLPSGAELNYEITGGYNDNAVRVTWTFQQKTHRLRWLYLKTFTGGSLKMIPESKRPPAVFALADEDAYCYCDKDPCLECVFRCKRGFVVYAMIEGAGLVAMPLDRMSPYWETRKKTED